MEIVFFFCFDIRRNGSGSCVLKESILFFVILCAQRVSWILKGTRNNFIFKFIIRETSFILLVII